MSKYGEIKTQLAEARDDLALAEQARRTHARGRGLTAGQERLQRQHEERLKVLIDNLEAIVAKAVGRRLGLSMRAAAGVDPEELETIEETRYVLIVADDIEDIGDLADIADLRWMDNPPEAGIEVLWSDERQSIVAFVFDPSAWDEAEADEWVRSELESEEA